MAYRAGFGIQARSFLLSREGGTKRATDKQTQQDEFEETGIVHANDSVGIWQLTIISDYSTCSADISVVILYKFCTVHCNLVTVMLPYKMIQVRPSVN